MKLSIPFQLIFYFSIARLSFVSTSPQGKCIEADLPLSQNALESKGRERDREREKERTKQMGLLLCCLVLKHVEKERERAAK
jgi:hypothetical protein